MCGALNGCRCGERGRGVNLSVESNVTGRIHIRVDSFALMMSFKFDWLLDILGERGHSSTRCFTNSRIPRAHRWTIFSFDDHFTSEYSIQIALILSLNVAPELSPQVLGAHELTFDLIALRLHNSERERFEFLDVRVAADGEIDAEPVPLAAVPVLQVLLEPIAQVARKADVIELVAFVKGVNSFASANIIANDVLIFLERVARNIFKVLRDELCASCHGVRV